MAKMKYSMRETQGPSLAADQTPGFKLLSLTNPISHGTAQPFGSTGTSSGDWQQTETCTVRAYHTPRQPLQSHPSGQGGECVRPWSAEEMLDGVS